MSPGSSTESYPAFARIGLSENPGKNLNQVTCLDQDSNPGNLISQPDALTVTPKYAVREVQENGEVLELKELKYQLLVYADDMNMLVGNPQTIKENRRISLGAIKDKDGSTEISQNFASVAQTTTCTVAMTAIDPSSSFVPISLQRDVIVVQRSENTDILLEASKAIDLEVNPGKTKYMIMSRDQNIVRNVNIKIGDLSFEEVEKFKYLGATVTNINDTREEIKRIINKGNACYYSVEKPLSSILLSKNLKVRIYKTVILPVLLYGCETWTLTLREEHRLRVFENKVLRKIFGAKRDEATGEWRQLHNTELHALYSSPNIIRNLKSRRLIWAGHVARMGESRNAYRVYVPPVDPPGLEGDCKHTNDRYKETVLPWKVNETTDTMSHCLLAYCDAGLFRMGLTIHCALRTQPFRISCIIVIVFSVYNNYIYIHVLGFCKKGELLRNKRHHRARTTIANLLRNRGWEVHEEIHCVSEDDSHRRVDIIAINRRTQKAMVLDPTICFERDTNQALQINDDKRAKYVPCPPYLSEKYAISLYNWDVTGLLFGARGCLPKFTCNILKSFKIPFYEVPKIVVVITEDVQNVHLLLEYRPHIDVSLTCEHDPKLQEYYVCPQNMPQFDSEGIPNQAPETNKPMILNGPTSRNREGSHQGENTEKTTCIGCSLQAMKLDCNEEVLTVQEVRRQLESVTVLVQHPCQPGANEGNKEMSTEIAGWHTSSVLQAH
ncbi:hypothetical protein ANN_02113 [Periplaneta americana]|uniref:Uncharacterized protein n=1 Tax=Periplaneta americana TaxID=6978 RepID=A0ABQ8TVI1_PERAM|nr:hypothetical protein ANN_02113 [Periplaneta americana]